MRTPWLVGLCLLLSVGSHAEGPGEVGRTLDIYVDATGGADLGMRLVASGLEVGEQFWVKQVVDDEIYRFTEPVFTTPAGEVLPWVTKNSRSVVEKSPSDTLEVRYRVTPGGKARHGHQGLVTRTWAGFDGRAVLQPREIAAFDDVRWHFTLPEGWSVASSMLPLDEGSWRMPPMEPRYRASVLKGLCMGLGPFVEDKRTVGEAEFRVFTLERWEDREALSNQAHSVVKYFHDTLGFSPTGPFAVVWTPPGPGMAPVWSGSGATATCYERPQKGFHNWELLGHRVAHPMNEYAPLGFAHTVPEDRWFMEGWATYIERMALSGAGVAGMERLNPLLRQHYDELDAHPEWADFALRDELQARGEIVENLHYRRGALVSMMLADHLQRRSGKTLEQFMRHVFETHGGFQKGFDLRAELAAFSGVPMDDFWAAMVDAPGPVIPVWKEYGAVLPAARPGPAVRAGELGWSGEQLFAMLQSGEFRGAVDLAETLQETGRKHAELSRRNVHLLGPDVEPLRLAFSARTRSDLDALERSWPLEGGPPLQSGGCWGGGGPLETPRLESADEDGRAFLALVEAERAAHSFPGGRDGLVGIRLGIDEFEPAIPGSVAAVGTTEKLRVMIQWEAPGLGMRVEVWKGDKRLARRWAETQSDWRSTWVRFADDTLGDATGLLDVRLVSEGKVIGNRPVWRRSSLKREQAQTEEEPAGEGGD